jgi:LCP family protein required for cell wall assembly
VRQLRRAAALALVLALTLLVVPSSSVRDTDLALVRVESARAVDHPDSVVWVLCLGSDARPGQRLLRQRADAIQLVGLNLDTGAGSLIGVPRDSYVEVRGHGRRKINDSMSLGGPQLMADSVRRLVGIRPDYVLTTGFRGFRAMVRAIGGVTVDSAFSFSDPVRPQGYHRGRNRLNAYQALMFGRVRKQLPRGDLDRSANQQDLLRGILAEVRRHRSTPGLFERGLLAAARALTTDLRPTELFRLAAAVTTVQPGRLRGCVLPGRAGYAGAASVVFPDVVRARRLGNDARRDGTLDRRC